MEHIFIHYLNAKNNSSKPMESLKELISNKDVVGKLETFTCVWEKRIDVDVEIEDVRLETEKISFSPRAVSRSDYSLELRHISK